MGLLYSMSTYRGKKYLFLISKVLNIARHPIEFCCLDDNLIVDSIKIFEFTNFISPISFQMTFYPLLVLIPSDTEIRKNMLKWEFGEWLKTCSFIASRDENHTLTKCHSLILLFVCLVHCKNIGDIDQDLAWGLTILTPCHLSKFPLPISGSYTGKESLTCPNLTLIPYDNSHSGAVS